MAGKKTQRIQYRLDTKGIEELSYYEITAVLRGAHGLILKEGPNLLAKVLKGLNDEQVLEMQLDKSPVYGYFKNDTLSHILAKIDWAVVNGYLDIEYNYRMPLLVYTPKGWEIQKDICSDELLVLILKKSIKKDFQIVYRLKDENREITLMLLNKINLTRDVRFIPFLKAWKAVEHKNIKPAINQTLRSLSGIGNVMPFIKKGAGS